MTQSKKRMRVRLRAKLSASFVGVTLFGGLVAGLLVDRNVRHATRSSFEDRLSYQATMLGQMTANALFGDLDPNDTGLSAPVHALGEAVHTQLAVIAKDGTIVADSSTDDPHGRGPQQSQPEIVAARATGFGIAVHDGNLYVARAIVRDGTTLGFARVSVPTSEVDRYVSQVRERMAWGSLLALLAAMILGLVLSSSIVRPIKTLSEGARRVGKGDFEHEIKVTASDEIGDLAGSFNEMTTNLRSTMAVLDGRNRDMRLVLDNVDQGLMTLDHEGTVSAERSLAVDRWLGTSEPGMRFSALLERFDPRAASSFALQWEEVIDGLLPMSVNIEQLPKVASRGDQSLELSYTPILRGAQLDKVLVVVSDVTARRAAERAEAEQREVACIFEFMIRDKSGVLEFLLDAESQVRTLTDAERLPRVETLRRLHTLKGNFAIYGLQRLSALCHDIESRLVDTKDDVSLPDRAALAAGWARMSDRLSAFVGDSTQIVIDDEDYAAVVKALFDGTPREDVSRMVRDWRLERVSDRLLRYAPGAHQLAARLEKGAVAVEVPRSTLRLPREQWSPFWAAFTHVVRNAVDHGMETEEERRLAGKNTPATLRLTAVQCGAEVVVEASDNGRGIDWSRVAEKARQLGLPSSSREDLIAAMFADGVSTRNDVTDVSGRGVGLAAAKDACEQLGGYVSVESRESSGTTFSFHVPLPARSQSLPPHRDSLRIPFGAHA